MKIYPKSSLAQIGAVGHPVFKYVEQRFFNWFDKAPQYIKDQYDGFADEPGCYTKKGAIRQAIENAIEYADETGKPVDLRTFDIECAFD